MDDKRYIIFLDEKLIENYGNKYLKEVITHEYAHILHWCIYGQKNDLEIHGKEWKEIMLNLGVKRPTMTTKKFGTPEEILKLHNN